MKDACPHCGTSLQGAPVPDEHRQHKPDHDEQVARYGRCYCLPYGDATHFRREVGIQVSGVYDGVLYWSCPDCGLAWPRDFGVGTRLQRLSEEFALRVNAEVASEDPAV